LDDESLTARAADAASRPLFIVGCPRSGTTLLRNLLRSHPHLTIPPETHFIPRFYRAYGDPANEAEALALASRILKLDRMVRIKGELQPRDFKDCRTYRHVVERLLGGFARRQGKRRWADKTPPYLEELPTLVRIFPDAQFLHLIRDGRDVAMSWVESGFDPGNLFMAATLWNRQIRRCRADATLLPPGAYFEIRYEQLLANPEATLRAVCRFADEPYSPDILNITRFADDGRTNARSQIDGSNVEKWRDRMSRSDQALFESRAGGLLGELGYPVMGLRRRISATEVAWWNVHHGVIKGLRHAAWSMDPARARTGYENTVARFKAWRARRS